MYWRGESVEDDIKEKNDDVCVGGKEGDSQEGGELTVIVCGRDNPLYFIPGSRKCLIEFIYLIR